MRKVLLIVCIILSAFASFFIATNFLAFLAHNSALLGRPQFGKLYEPFHIVWWTITLHAGGNQFKYAYISLLVSFIALSSLCFFVYVHSKSNLLGIYGSSRWLKRSELKKSGAFKPAGVILGQTKDAKYFHLGDKYKQIKKGDIIFNSDKEHILLIAPTRRGKGISVILPTLLSVRDSSVIVFDLKKENFLISAGWRRQFSHVLKYEPCSHDSIHINILKEIEPGEPSFTQAQIIADQITNPDGETSQKSDYWRDSAKDLICALILYAMGEQGNENRKVRFSLPGIYEYFNNPAWNKDSVFNDLLGSKNINVQQVGRQMLDKAPNELSGVVSSVNQYLHPFADPVVASNCEDSDFELSEIYSSPAPVSLYICLNPGELKANKALVRILLQVIANKITENISQKKNKILFILDEFIALGRMAYYEEGLQFFAGYGMRLMIVCQSFKQLYGVYGKETSIIANCRFKAVLGSGDPDDSKLISDFCGTLSFNKESTSSSGTLGNIIAANRSKSITEAERKLMNADDVFRMPYEDFILLTDGSYPYKGRKIMYYLDDRFNSRANLPGVPDSRNAQVKETPAYARYLLLRKTKQGKSKPRTALPAPTNIIGNPTTSHSPFAEFSPAASNHSVLVDISDAEKQTDIIIVPPSVQTAEIASKEPTTDPSIIEHNSPTENFDDDDEHIPYGTN